MNGTLAIGMPNGWEWLVILVIALVVFGGYKKLPEVGSSLAGSIRNFKKGMDEGRDDEAAASNDPVTAETTTPPKTETRS
jgi:sec-independent protein translocase protein TatA